LFRSSEWPASSTRKESISKCDPKDTRNPWRKFKVQTGLLTVPRKNVPYYVGIGLCTNPMRPVPCRVHVPQDARLSLGRHWTEQTCAEFNAELVRHIFAHPAPVKVFASRVGRVQYQRPVQVKPSVETYSELQNIITIHSRCPSLYYFLMTTMTIIISHKTWRLESVNHLGVHNDYNEL